MKKNVIALAVAAAMTAPLAAQADVSVKGQVKLTVGNMTDVSLSPSFDNTITFPGSEDLGNGMTSFASITIDADGDKTATGAMATKDSVLGLKGGFGTIVAGRMETLSEGKISSQMDDGASSHGNDQNLESSISDIKRQHALAYVSNSFNGLTIGVAGVLDGTEDALRATDIALMYANGPLSVNFGMTSFTDNDATAADETDKDYSILGASYTMGALKLGGQYVSRSSDDSVDMILRADYKMGNNSILLGMKMTDDDGASGNDVTAIKFTHSLSKTTAVWIGHRAIADNSDASNTHFGMIKKF
jgi:predicted porin